MDLCNANHTNTPWTKYAVLGFRTAQFATRKEGRNVLSLQDLCSFRVRSSMAHVTSEHQLQIEKLPLPQSVRDNMRRQSEDYFNFREHDFQIKSHNSKGFLFINHE